MPAKPNPPLYFLSLYFRLDTFSGANKRFESLARNLYTRIGERLHLIVSKGEAPDFLPRENVLTVESYSTAGGASPVIPATEKTAA